MYKLVLASLLIIAAGLMFMGPKLIAPILRPLGLGQVSVTVWAWARSSFLLNTQVMISKPGIYHLYREWRTPACA
jgi:hypothetical protein